MDNTIVFVSLITLAAVAMSAMVICVLAIRASALRGERTDRTMSELVGKLSDSLVTPEGDQVRRIQAEKRVSPDPIGMSPIPSPIDPLEAWEIAGGSRDEAID